MIKRLGLVVLGAGALASGTLLLTSGLASAHRAGAGGTLPTLTLALNGKSVEVGGSEVSGAVKIVTTVTKEAAGQPALFHLNKGVSPADFGKAVATVQAHQGDLNYLDPYGQLVFDLGGLQGQEQCRRVPPGGQLLRP